MSGKGVEKTIESFGKDADCYKCKFRGTVAGSCHSSCNHKLGVVLGLDMSHYVKVTNSETDEVIEIPIIEADQHGIDNGWFMFPFNFDPIWLERCILFEVKEK